MTPQQTIRLHNLTRAMRKVAAPVGPMHGWWDVIFDVEAFLQGKPVILEKTTEEWIKFCDDILKEYEHRKAT